MWLQEPRVGFRIFIILFQSSFLRFCHNLNFLSNSRSFVAACTWKIKNLIFLSPAPSDQEEAFTESTEKEIKLDKCKKCDFECEPEITIKKNI